MMIARRMTIGSSVDVAAGVISINEEVLEPDLMFRDEMVKNQVKLVIATRDQAVREALIKLGWTPPPGGR
jgi:hypothetical protein